MEGLTNFLWDIASLLIFCFEVIIFGIFWISLLVGFYRIVLGFWRRYNREEFAGKFLASVITSSILFQLFKMYSRLRAERMAKIRGGLPFSCQVSSYILCNLVY